MITAAIPQSDPDPTHQLWEQVFQEEVNLITSRRAADDSPEEGLIGLALSGGGIRSATFALGVLEGLKHCDLLRKIDYLSTVSGGGYIGAWLTANCKRAAERSEPDWLSRDARWKESIDHLRRYSNYLAPKVGFFSADTWSMGTVWLRNALLIQITVILAIATVLLLPRPLAVAFLNWPQVGHWRWLTIGLFILGVVGIAGNQLRLCQQNIPLLQFRSWRGGVVTATACLLAAWFIGHQLHFDPFVRDEMDYKAATPVAALLIFAGFWLQPVAIRLVNRLWTGANRPRQINYTQGWVQAVVVFPMLAVGFLVSAILWGQSQETGGKLALVDTFGGFFSKGWLYWPFPLSVVFISLWLLSFCSIRKWRDWRAMIAALLAPLPAMLVLHALLSGIMLLFHGWAQNDPRGDWLAFVWGPPLVLYSFSIAIVILIGMMGRQSTEDVREWWSRFGAWLLIYGTAWTLINIAAVYGPLFSAVLSNSAKTWRGVSLTWIVTTLAGLLAGKSGATGEGAAVKKSTFSTALEVIATFAPFVFIAGLLVGVSTTLNFILLNMLGLSGRNQDSLAIWHWWLMESANLDWPVMVELMAACFLGLLLFAARVDINEFSLNAFYRSRLVRCYLGATRFRLSDQRNPQYFTGFDDDDDLRMADLTSLSGRLTGPLHIVNCALNLGGSSDLALHSRHSAIFTITPLTAGTTYRSHTQAGENQELGYRPTYLFGGESGQPSLGQAISVSGAAASPNRGYHTSPAVAFLLTMFNVRLGWWFPNPLKANVVKPSPWFSLRYILKELFGGANEKSGYLAISDGGHFENLGAYELIKRKCKIVIVSDAECDADLQFEGLGNLIRICDVDFGAKIDIDVGSIRRSATAEWSNSRCAVGTIDYSDGLTGTLIYLKASMSGHEGSGVMQYRSAHPSFPHESTGNQFYGEDQFESYRSLGYDVAVRTFESASADESFAELASKLEKIFSSGGGNLEPFTRHSVRLMDLWSQLRGNPDFGFIDSQLASDWPQQPPPNFRSSFYLCREMIQLMENVYLDLRLEETWNQPDHSGWMATFNSWANSPALLKTWELTNEAYGLRFRYFCHNRLRLPLSNSAGKTSAASV